MKVEVEKLSQFLQEPYLASKHLLERQRATDTYLICIKRFVAKVVKDKAPQVIIIII
jgi:hypothetical protein